MNNFSQLFKFEQVSLKGFVERFVWAIPSNGFCKLISCKHFLKGSFKRFVWQICKQFTIVFSINNFSTKCLQTASSNGFFKSFVDTLSLNVSVKDSVKGSFKGSFQRLIWKVAWKGFFKVFPWHVDFKCFAERVFQRLFQRILKSYWTVSSMASLNHVLWWLRKRWCCASHFFFRPGIVAFRCFRVQLLRV